MDFVAVGSVVVVGSMVVGSFPVGCWFVVAWEATVLVVAGRRVDCLTGMPVHSKVETVVD